VCEFASLASKDEDPTVVKHLYFVLELTAAKVTRYKDLQGEIICRMLVMFVQHLTFTVL